MNYLVKSFPKVKLSREQEREHLKNYQETGDEESFNVLVGAYVEMILRYIRRYNRKRSDVEDVFQESLLSFRNALKKFDFSKGTRFFTYAGHWIRNTIQRYNKDNLFSLKYPEREYLAFFRYEARKAELEQEKGRHISDNEFCEIDKKNIAGFVRNPEENIEDFEFFSSLEEREKLEQIPENARKILEKKEIKKYLNSFLGYFVDEREKQVIEMRYGLNGYYEHTLEEVGNKFGVTRERVRQLQKRALERLENFVNESDFE